MLNLWFELFFKKTKINKTEFSTVLGVTRGHCYRLFSGEHGWTIANIEKSLKYFDDIGYNDPIVLSDFECMASLQNLLIFAQRNFVKEEHLFSLKNEQRKITERYQEQLQSKN